jgi:PAS domain S-box-containing protein
VQACALPKRVRQGHLAKKPVIGDGQKLRKRAEAKLARSPPRNDPRSTPQKVQHELQVHQVELEMQNEQLRHSTVALEQAHARYVDLYDFAPVGYLLLDEKGLITQANLTSATLLGEERGGLVGRPLAAFVAHSDADRWHIFLSGLAQDGERHSCRVVLQQSDGSTFYAHLACQQQATGGAEAGVRVVLTDVSQFQRLEQELRDSRRTLSLFIEHTPAAIAMVDRGMRYLAVSRRWLADYRLDQVDVLGRSHYEVFPEIPERWKEIHRRCMAGASEKCEQDPFPRSDGSVDWVRWEIHPWLDAGGEVGGLVVFSEVITERLALQAQLAVASRLAAMGTLVAGVAHEINNPLTGSLSGQMFALDGVRDVQRRLHESAPLDREAEGHVIDEVVEALEDAHEGGRRVAQIVRDLAMFGRPDPQRKRVRLLDVVNSAMHWLPSSVGAVADVTVENLGAPEVIAAAGQIEQVVVNLANNAARATPKGRRGSVTIRIGAGTPGMARVEVTDKGVGIEQAILERIFEPFFTTNELGKGMGLGLAISYAIVTANGGTLTVESQVGKGSVFRLELPVAPAEA